MYVAEREMVFTSGHRWESTLYKFLLSIHIKPSGGKQKLFFYPKYPFWFFVAFLISHDFIH